MICRPVAFMIISLPALPLPLPGNVGARQSFRDMAASSFAVLVFPRWPPAHWSGCPLNSVMISNSMKRRTNPEKHRRSIQIEIAPLTRMDSAALKHFCEFPNNPIFSEPSQVPPEIERLVFQWMNTPPARRGALRERIAGKLSPGGWEIRDAAGEVQLCRNGETVAAYGGF